MRCSATRRDGEGCRADARPERPFCFVHDPTLQNKAEQARKVGGYNSSTANRAAKRVPKDLRELASTLMGAITEVHRGELEPRALSAMAAGASAVVKLYEVGEFEARLRELEARAATVTKSRR